MLDFEESRPVVLVVTCSLYVPALPVTRRTHPLAEMPPLDLRAVLDVVSAASVMLVEGVEDDPLRETV